MLTPEQLGIQENLRKQAILSNFKEYNDNASVNESIVANDVQKSENLKDIDNAEIIEKSETKLEVIERTLNEKLEKGLITEESYNEAKFLFEILKGKLNDKE